MPQIKARSYAKINLYLKIKGLRPDGFHELETLMQNVSLYDELLFEEIKKGIEIGSNSKNMPHDARNICHKAASLLINEHKIDKGVRITIQKDIPMEAGMGGGSSNGAATLIALDKLWELGLSQEQLISYAAKLGSDVPFFIVGGRAVCKGRGEKVEKVNGEQGTGNRYIVIKPDVSVPTKWAYAEWDKSNMSSRGSLRAVIASGAKQRALDAEDGIKCIGSKVTGLLCETPVDGGPLHATALQYENDLEDVVLPHYPQIVKAKQDLLDAGCSVAMMTGSGSAVFGIVDGRIAEAAHKKLSQTYPLCRLVSDEEAGVALLPAGPVLSR